MPDTPQADQAARSLKPSWIATLGLPARVRCDSVSEEFFKNTRFESVVRQNSLDARIRNSIVYGQGLLLQT